LKAFYFYGGIIIVEIRLTQRIVQTIIENLRNSGGRCGKTVANNSISKAYLRFFAVLDKKQFC
jgi:hypothetical protein